MDVGRSGLNVPWILVTGSLLGRGIAGSQLLVLGSPILKPDLWRNE
jgi:hypothetical protein